MPPLYRPWTPGRPDCCTSARSRMLSGRRLSGAGSRFRMLPQAWDSRQCCTSVQPRAEPSCRVNQVVWAEAMPTRAEQFHGMASQLWQTFHLGVLRP